jgi:hypothetical protein
MCFGAWNYKRSAPRLGVILFCADVRYKSQGLHPDLFAFAYDARRFMTSNFRTIAKAPLQVYCSPLVFALSKSLVRGQFLRDQSPWISCLPELQHGWNEEELVVEATNKATT